MSPEPLLRMDEIQGLVLPGFLKPQVTLIQMTGIEDRTIAALSRMSQDGVFASGAAALQDRLAYRSGVYTDGVLVGLALSSGGLNELSVRLSDAVPSVAFRDGMNDRAGLLGDPELEAEPSTALAQKRPGALLVIAGNCREAVDRRVHELIDDYGLKAFYLLTQTGGILPSTDGSSREHFGFVDGISQPGIRGRISDEPDSYLTPRRLPKTDPEHDLFGYPGQNLVWPGEFVLGYPASGPDPRIPGPVRPVPAWMHNGSFLVYRRLKQDVFGFRQWLKDKAAEFKSFPGFGGLNDKERVELLAAKVVGRWRSGAPLSRSPKHDDPSLARCAMANNDFRFDDDSPDRRKLANFPTAKADSLGGVCPVSAHIRKLNVRDQASDVGGTSATQARRILRVGIPYGPPLPTDAAKDDRIDRGLLFMSIQASIEDQFEFLQARWMNNAFRPRGPGGHDLLVGQPDGSATTTLFSPDLRLSQPIERTKRFITLTGGGYFFVPSLTTLRHLLTSGSPTG